jgi:hypothetical protein
MGLGETLAEPGSAADPDRPEADRKKNKGDVAMNHRSLATGESIDIRWACPYAGRFGQNRR